MARTKKEKNDDIKTTDIKEIIEAEEKFLEVKTEDASIEIKTDNPPNTEEEKERCRRRVLGYI